jgi:hypothetical protein
MARSGSPICAATRARISIERGPNRAPFSGCRCDALLEPSKKI